MPESLTLTLPDGSPRQVAAGTHPIEVVKTIGERLARDAIAVEVNGKVQDLNTPLRESGPFKVLTAKDPRALDVLRHSAAHILATAVRRLRPEAKIGFGPAIEDGFYYDFEVARPFTPEDLEQFEKEMAKVAQEKFPFVREEVSRGEAEKRFRDDPLKLERLGELGDDEVISVYTDGPFVDLCRGPHVPDTSYLKHFKLMTTAGAYWRGDERRQMLQRIYGTAWFRKEDLDAHLHRLEEAKRRDHRVVGKALDLFMFHQFSPGAAFWTEKGTIVYNELVNFVQERQREHFLEIKTPLLYNKGLWETSGHWGKYRENMFLVHNKETEELDSSLKPMNCPSHYLLYLSKKHSYRELPKRYVTFDVLHRNEVTGALSGLTRVRQFQQDDCHVFLMQSQIADEVNFLMKFILDYYATFGLTATVKFATRPEVRIGSDTLWDEAEAALKKALDATGQPYELKPGDGAFYGPKIDFDVTDSIGRAWQLGTIQLDYNAPERFDLSYVGEDNAEHRPVVIHRAVSGSFERFIAILIEHFAGAFPLWLAPEQVRVLPISDELAEAGSKLTARLKEAGIRASLDNRADTLNYRIREGELMRVPYMAVIGKREAEAGTVALRVRGAGKKQEIIPVEEFVARVVQEKRTRALAPLGWVAGGWRLGAGGWGLEAGGWLATNCRQSGILLRYQHADRRPPSPLFLNEVQLDLRRLLILPACVVLGAGCKDPLPTTGDLVVNIDGLPAGAFAAVGITGPQQFTRFVQATTTLEKLVPGDYVIRVDTVTVDGTRYGVPAVFDTIAIARGKTETAVASYRVSSGAVRFTVNGVAPHIPVNLRLVGPNYDALVAAAGTVNGLTPGQYVVHSDTMISIEGDRLAAAKTRDTLQVPASVTPVDAVVDYTLISGAIALSVDGIPAVGTATPISVDGPNGYRYLTNSTRTIRGLVPGTYTINASRLNGECPTIYTPSQGQQTLQVARAQTSEATVTYSRGQVNPADLNLRIDALHLTQASQDYAGTVPIVEGKPALLRVFGVANQCNSSRPRAQVTLSNGGAVVMDTLLDFGEDSVRTATAQGVMAASWNVVVPANLVQRGLAVAAVIDPSNAVAEADESDNRLPASGSRSLDVRAIPTLGIRMVPITQSTINTTGSANAGNMDLWMMWPRRILPVANYDVDIREPLTTSLTLTASGGGWSGLLGEVDAVRIQEGTGRYYYGVARVNYTSGVAGIAYVGGRRTGLGWDYVNQNPQQNSASRVFAHELGHNFGRFHSPCGTPSGIDSRYPTGGAYVNGGIGQFGWDPIEGLKAADLFTDIMGYCNNQWISDYTYKAIMDWLLTTAPSAPAVTGAAEEPALLVWGRIVSGQPVLEPVFETTARPALPDRGGPHRLTALDASGTELFSFAFAGNRVADLPGEEETFAFAVPVSALRGRSLASLRLSSGGRTVSNVASATISADPSATLARVGAGAVRLRWDASRYPVVMVRDQATGRVLSFARGGDITIATRQNALELNFSNRVSSTRRSLRLQ